MSGVQTLQIGTEYFLEKTKTRELRVGVIGLGYVGLPLSLLFSEQKFRVTGFDVDQKKVDTLSAGGSYIYRILPEEIAAAKNSGFSATADYRKERRDRDADAGREPVRSIANHWKPARSVQKIAGVGINGSEL